MRRTVVMLMLAGLALRRRGRSDRCRPRRPRRHRRWTPASEAGSFNIAERICQAYSPSRGAQFGPISGIQVLRGAARRPHPAGHPRGR